MQHRECSTATEVRERSTRVSPLAGSGTSVYAVDTSVLPRCDAETSPERAFYYHPSRHTAGQPIAAGWAYQFVAQLNFVRQSWTAPVDVERVRPAQGDGHYFPVRLRRGLRSRQGAAGA